jgi:bifunctional non-homologous end joining protein LigD
MQPPPGFIAPQLAKLARYAPAGEQWLHEIKIDGYRTGARVGRGSVIMLTRTGLDWTKRFLPIAWALAELPVRSAYFDGEIAVLGENGVSSFAALQDARSRGASKRLVYFVFDLLFLDGRDLRELPLLERKIELAQLIKRRGRKGGPIRYSSHVVGDGASVYRQACKMHLEGIVSKLWKAPYRSDRGGAWVKVKCSNRQEFVIGGWLKSEAAGRELRSLLVGYREGGQRDGKLIFAGKVGTGFSERLGRDLARRLGGLTRPDSPFAGVPVDYRKGAIWVEPRLVAQVEFKTWTADRLLRAASFQGLREDKPAAEVTRERSAR